MDVFWLEQSEADVPAADDWLSESEALRLSGLRIAKRRSDWRLGRWTAKCAVATSLKLAHDLPTFKLIEIIPAPTGQPEVILRERAETVTISISHRNGIAICAVSVGNVKLGCDLELIEARSDAFVTDYFTPEEQKLIAQASGEERHLLVSLLWSAKESALKAMHVGLRADTRSVEVKLPRSGDPGFKEATKAAKEVGRSIDQSNDPAGNWHPLQVHCVDGIIFGGWWRHSENILRTIVAAQTPAEPIELRFQSHAANIL